MSETRSYRAGPVTMIPVGNFWHYRFQLKGYPRVMKTTKEPLRNRVKAEQVGLDAHEAAKLRARGEEPEPILREAVAMWVAAHVLRKSPAHISNVERFGRLHLGTLAELKLTQLTTTRVEEELNTFLANHVKSTANQWLTYLRIVCKWAVRRRMIRAVPFDVPEISFKKRPKPLLPTEKVLLFLARVEALTRKDPGIAMVIWLMVGLGLRPSEARRARWEWVDWERGTYTPADTKGGDVVSRSLPPWLLDDLKACSKPFGWMVPTRKGAVVTAGRLGAIVTAACKSIGIARLTPHRLRATYATWLSEDGATIQDIREALEHKDINTTAGYLGIDLSRVARAQQRTAERTGLAGRRSGEVHHAVPHRVTP